MRESFSVPRDTSIPPQVSSSADTHKKSSEIRPLSEEELLANNTMQMDMANMSGQDFLAWVTKPENPRIFRRAFDLERSETDSETWNKLIQEYLVIKSANNPFPRLLRIISDRMKRISDESAEEEKSTHVW